MGLIDGKTAIITGGGTGIGGAVARRFAAEGATVAVLDVPLDGANAVVADIKRSGGNAFAEACDVSQPDQVVRAVESVASRSGRVDALVNGAGALDKADFLEIEPEKLGTCGRHRIDGLIPGQPGSRQEYGRARRGSYCLYRFHLRTYG